MNSDTLWTPWVTPFAMSDATILSAALQTTDAVGPNMANLRADPTPVVQNTALEVRLGVFEEARIYSIKFDRALVFAFREESYEWWPNKNEVADADPTVAGILRRALSADEDPYFAEFTHWIVQDGENILDVLSPCANPHISSEEWTY